MEIAVGLDRGLGLSWDQYRELGRHAAGLGYQSVWTNASHRPRPHADLCPVVHRDRGHGARRHRDWRLGDPGRLLVSRDTGVLRGDSRRDQRRQVRARSGLRRYSKSAAFRRSLGLDDGLRPIGAMREWLVTLRALLAGETVEHEGKAFTLHGISLGSPPPKVPVALGALGPKMLTLAGEAADGAALNWCTPEQVAVSRATVTQGAQAAGRDPSEIAMIEYIRICVDDDVDAARRAYTKALMGYALAPPGANKALGYRGHFARMGFDEALTELEDRRDRGASDEELIDAFPIELAELVGYFGPASGAATAFRRLAEGLDTAIVRVVAARPGLESDYGGDGGVSAVLVLKPSGLAEKARFQRARPRARRR